MDTTSKSFTPAIFAITSTLPVSFTESGDEWTAVDGDNTWKFTESTGVLSLTVASGTPFSTWAATKITAINPSADATPGGDPDGDGKTNFSEFAFDGNPLSGSDNGKIFVLAADSDVDVNTDKELILTVAVRAAAPAFSGTPSPTATGDGVIYTIQGSTTLTDIPDPGGRGSNPGDCRAARDYRCELRLSELQSERFQRTHRQGLPPRENPADSLNRLPSTNS